MPSWEFCAAVAKPLGMRPEDMFRLAGLLRQRRGDDDETTFERVYDLMRELSREERQRVLEYIAWRWQVEVAERSTRSAAAEEQTAEGR